jgi:hypothetical protein
MEKRSENIHLTNEKIITFAATSAAKLFINKSGCGAVG